MLRKALDRSAIKVILSKAVLYFFVLKTQTGITILNRIIGNVMEKIFILFMELPRRFIMAITVRL